eukprot:1885959-Pyramimonas_sp.AAC.1
MKYKQIADLHDAAWPEPSAWGLSVPQIFQDGEEVGVSVSYWRPLGFSAGQRGLMATQDPTGASDGQRDPSLSQGKRALFGRCITYWGAIGGGRKCTFRTPSFWAPGDPFGH